MSKVRRRKQVREAQERYYNAFKEAGYKRTVIYVSAETDANLKRLRADFKLTNKEILNEGVELLMLSKGIVNEE